MRIYIVYHSDDGIEGAYSTQEKASEAIELLMEENDDHSNDYSITEVTLDK